MASILDEDDASHIRERVDSRMSAASTPDSLAYPSFASTTNHVSDAHQSSLSRAAGVQASSGAVLGQFAFGPAMQTTVVTTTTTTTTQLPPLTMPGPQRRYGLDRKQYPLADTPTPASLRNIAFELGGKRTIFTEADDSSLALEQFQRESEELQRAGGSVESVRVFESTDPRRLRTLSKPLSRKHSVAGGKNISLEPASTGKKPQISGSACNELSRTPQSSSTAIKARFSSPTTPAMEGSMPDKRRIHRRIRIRERDLMQDPESSFEASDSNLDEAPRPNKYQKPEPRHLGKLKGHLATPLSSRAPQQDRHMQGLIPDNVVPTPPIQDDDTILFGRQPSHERLSSIPSRLATTDNSAAQDGSLPSPCLSPVAASGSQHSSYFMDEDSFEEETFEQDNDVDELGIYLSETPSKASMVTARQSPAPTPAPEPIAEASRQRTFSDIPAMLDFFEAIPDEFKSWVMHQLLRRCPKPTLQIVADVVNPALKCDFLAMLPPELSLNVLKYLDAQSLCRASQVSKKWRHIINSDEQAWKNLLDMDGFTLPEGELQRAILEGWGWQDPSGSKGYERDISILSSGRSDSDVSRPVTPQLAPSYQRQTLNALAGNSSRRPKRKAALKVSSRSKQAKRSAPQGDLNVTHSVALLEQLGNLDGPYNAANAASMAVPYPQVEMPSLKDLHLFKSLYRRHYLIRKSWMQEDIQPRHIAFRAHDRHVVTCLQFDSDKIITGSDDTNINVYDTKTGKLRARLQGHEGGVWALQYEGNTLVSGSTDRSVRVWDIEKGRQMQVFQGHTSTVRCLQILLPTKVGETSDGRPIMMPKQPMIITGSRDSNLRVWKLPQPGDQYYYQAGPPQDDTDCPYFVRTLSGHGHSVRAIAAHADVLVSGSYDTTVRVWKISTGEVLHRLQGHSQKVYSVVLDHARNRCISGSMDNLVKIWSLESGTCLYTLNGHSSLVGLLDLNSERLVSAAADSTLRIWDPENGQCKATLSAHTGAITCFQHDGQKVISGSDRTLKMWNVKTGECVKDLLRDLSGVWQVKFNERSCVAAVQRDNMTYVEVLDFGASRDGVPEKDRGRRIVVDVNGVEIADPMAVIDLDSVDAVDDLV